MNRQLDRALILLALVFYLPSASVSLVFRVLHVFNFLVTFLTLPFCDLSLVGLALDLVD